MAETGIDHLAISGHKLYAPFGAGALVSQSALGGEPLLHGGGAIKLVTLDDVIWADAPDRFEAGSPNVIGAVAFAAACEALEEIGMDALAEREKALSKHLDSGLKTIPGLQQLALWPGHEDRVGVASFTLIGHTAEQLAARLSDDYAIGVRHGCFCAHPLITRLLKVPEIEARRLHAELRRGLEPELPGAVRASLGLGTTIDDIDALIGALGEISRPRR
jgi:selenocysteine lyase/cysteine desulfurase